MKKYNPQKIESKWQEYWLTNETFKATENPDKEKKFVLVEFPYPSGEGMHMGHVRPYTAADVLARYLRMTGKEVLFPMGWDAFGLPAENYAIKHGVQPAVTTAKNISNIKRQFQSIGYSFDWSREFSTTDPGYYKWTQWLFLQFYKAGLAYEATGLINWCPKDKTGLAIEEVVNGSCERCGTVVEKKELRQWYLKITAYAEKLLEGLKNLPEWPEAVKLQQENWIGKSVGAEIEFKISPHPAFSHPLPQGEGLGVRVFTTRVDTIFGATYLVLAPEHDLINQLSGSIQNIAEVQSYIETAKAKEELVRTAEGKDKTGVELQGIKAINPASGEEISVWVADYVLGNYGTGAIMAVPAHDERDFEFAKKFNIAIKQVVAPHVIDTVNPPREGEQDTDREMVNIIVLHPTENKFLSLKWKTQPWQTFISGGIEEEETAVETAQREVLEETGYKNMIVIGQMPFVVKAEFYAAHKKVNRRINAHAVMLKLNDLEQDPVADEESEQFEPMWLDMEEMKNLGPVSELPYILDWIEHGDHPYTGKGVLINSGEFNNMNSKEALVKMAQKYGTSTVQYKLRDWVFSRQRYWGEPIPLVHCEKDGVVAIPDNQLPILLPEVENYEPTGTGESPLATIDDWVNTTCPTCGGPAKRETNTMPQWAGSSWYYLRYTDSKNDQEFAAADKLKYWLPVDTYFGGMEHTTLHLLYSRFWNIFLHDLGLLPVSEPYTKRVPHGLIIAGDGTKMSKSKGNVVNPDEIINNYGADTMRMYELFLGPHKDSVSWSEQGITGVARFLDKTWQWINDFKPSQQQDSNTDRALHNLIKNIGEDIETFSYNTAVSSFMKFYNETKDSNVNLETMQTFVRLLYPFVPHLSEELNQILGGEGSVQNQAWPIYDESKLVSDMFNVVVQVNGKVRDNMEFASGSSEKEITAQALQNPKVSSILNGQEPKRTVYVAGRILNIVI